jgi:hypothetical protein
LTHIESVRRGWESSGREDLMQILARVLSWAVHSARGLAHLQHIKPDPKMHRDIKLANLLVKRKPGLYVTMITIQPAKCSPVQD